MSEKTNKQWIDLVKPVALGLVALMAAAASYLQYLQSGTNEKMESRLTAVEVQVETIQPWRSRVDGQLDNFNVILSDIRSDVAFIRGKMESEK